MAPEKEKFSADHNRPMHLPEGVQEIFTPDEADDATMSGGSLPPAPISKEEILKKAVESITGLVGSDPLMAPGPPQRLVEEASSATTALSSSTSLLPVAAAAAAVPAEMLSTSPAAEGANLALTPEVTNDNLSQNLSISPANKDVNLATASEGSHSTASSPEEPTTRVILLESLSKPSPWSMRPRTLSLSSDQPLNPQVGMVRPRPSPASPTTNPSGLLLHDFRPAEMLSRHVPAHVEIPHSFHNLLSDVFLNNLPCAQRSLLQAMALSLEDRQIPVLHGLDLPPDQGLLPDDVLHMGTFLYVGALFEEFEDHWQAALKERADVQQLLSQEKEKLRMCQDQLQALREVNSILAKSNSPVEREQLIRLQQECRSSSQRLQEVTNDFHEIKALSEHLQTQLTTAEEQRASASFEAQTSLDKLQASATELSRLKVKLIPMAEHQQSADTTQLKATMEKIHLEIEEKKQGLKEANQASKELKEQCESLKEDNIALKNTSAEKSASLEKAEKDIKTLKSTKTELTVQVKELSKERDAAAPLLSDAKIRAKSHQAEITTMQEEKKTLLQTVAARDEKISSLTGLVENLNKDKKKVSADIMKDLERAKETIANLNQEKTKLLRDIKADATHFFALKDNLVKQEGIHTEALRVSDDQIANLKEAAQSQIAIKASLEEQLNISANKVLDLTEQISSASVEDVRDEKTSYKKLKKRYDHVLKLLQEPASASDVSSHDNSENELEDETDSISNPQLSKASSLSEENPPEPEPEKNKKSYSAAAQFGTGASNSSSQEEDLEFSVRPEERFPIDSSRKRDRSERRISSSNRSRKKSRSGSSERQVRYKSSPPRQDRSNPSPGRQQQKRDLSPLHRQERRNSLFRQPTRETQAHYDLDNMHEDLHKRAYDLIRRHTAESVEAVSKDTGLIKFLRGPASIKEKTLKVQKLLKGYAQCTSLKELTALNGGTPPPTANSFQPLPDLSPSSEEWTFVQSIVQNNFVHFPSLMGLFRLYSTKVYAFFHYGRKSEAASKKNTISLLYTADKDDGNMKRSDWEKKLDLLLVLVTGRLVFYTLDHVSHFECNPDRSLHLSSPFLSDEFMEEMIASRSYNDPYLLPRKSMYFLYTECYGTKARREFNHRIARYEPIYSPNDEPKERSDTRKSSTFSWMDQ